MLSSDPSGRSLHGTRPLVVMVLRGPCAGRSLQERAGRKKRVRKDSRRKVDSGCRRRSTVVVVRRWVHHARANTCDDHVLRPTPRASKLRGAGMHRSDSVHWNRPLHQACLRAQRVSGCVISRNHAGQSRGVLAKRALAWIEAPRPGDKAPPRP